MLPTNPTERSYWIYLEALRRSGRTNMYGAAPYLAVEFGLSAKEASTILGEWMRGYDRKDYGGIKLPEVEA